MTRNRAIHDRPCMRPMNPHERRRAAKLTAAENWRDRRARCATPADVLAALRDEWLDHLPAALRPRDADADAAWLEFIRSVLQLDSIDIDRLTGAELERVERAVVTADMEAQPW